MDLIMRTILYLSVKWIVVSGVGAAIDHDCTGETTGVCRSPSSCLADFMSLCPAEGSVCCPEAVESFELDDFMDRMIPNCNKKCHKLYNGWWATRCVVGSRIMFYCEHTGLYCCSAMCRIQTKCVSLGGHCVSNKKKCNGKIDKKLCKGVSCFCCIPAPTAPATTTTTTTPLPTTTTTTTPPPTTTTTTTPSPTTTTTTTPLPTGPTLPPCPLTGESGVACNKPTTCAGHGSSVDGTFEICPISNCPPKTVKCQDGWTVILCRNTLATPRQNFKQNWKEYREGFGDADGEYWIGNEILYTLTGSSPYKMEMFGLFNATDERTLAYDSFSVGHEGYNYTLTVGGYNPTSSTGVDLFVNPPTTNIILNGMMFSTRDRDNDNREPGSCSMSTTQPHDEGGWWYNDCTGIRATRTKYLDWHYWNAGVYQQARVEKLYIRIKL